MQFVIFLQDGQDQIPVSTFSLRDVATGTDIVYEHDDTETTEDKFAIKVSDGALEDAAIIPITILPVDDETPRLTINNGIDVDIMETKVIGNDALKVGNSLAYERASYPFFRQEPFRCRCQSFR